METTPSKHTAAATTFDNGQGSSTMVGEDIEMGLISMDDFLQQVDDVRTQIQHLRRSAQALASAHARSLDSSSPQASQVGTSDAQRLSRETAHLSSEIRRRIVDMNSQNRRSAAGDPSFEVRRKQIEGLQAAFKRDLEEVFAVEKDARRRARERLERQFLIVKPHATQEELDEALAGSLEGRQIFADALTSNRAASARSAFHEASYRGQELRAIEETMTECARLMQDMASLVLEQDYAMEQIERDAGQVHEDVRVGHRQATIGKKLAAAARKKRWWAFTLTLIIAAVLAIVLGVTLSS